MSKADTLLKRAEFYEKLALYSDRNAFLQAIAQQSYMTEKFGPQLKTQLDSIIRDMGALRIDPNLVNRLTDMSESYTPFNRLLLVAALTQAAAQYPKTPQSAPQLQNLQNLITTLKGPETAPPQTDEYGTGTGTKVKEQPVKPWHSKYPPIDPKFQKMLGVNTDGALGNVTQSALDRYKASIDMPEISNALAFEYLKREPEYAAGKQMEFDDNSNLYNTLRQKQKRNPGLVTNTPF